jgi:hypothetical protein
MLEQEKKDKLKQEEKAKLEKEKKQNKKLASGNRTGSSRKKRKRDSNNDNSPEVEIISETMATKSRDSGKSEVVYEIPPELREIPNFVLGDRGQMHQKFLNDFTGTLEKALKNCSNCDQFSETAGRYYDIIQQVRVPTMNIVITGASIFSTNGDKLCEKTCKCKGRLMRKDCRHEEGRNKAKINIRQGKFEEWGYYETIMNTLWADTIEKDKSLTKEEKLKKIGGGKQNQGRRKRKPTGMVARMKCRKK